MILDICFGRSILRDREELPILYVHAEPTAQCEPAPRPSAPLASGLAVLAQMPAHESLGEPDFQLTPVARMDVAAKLQSLPRRR